LGNIGANDCGPEAILNTNGGGGGRRPHVVSDRDARAASSTLKRKSCPKGTEQHLRRSPERPKGLAPKKKREELTRSLKNGEKEGLRRHGAKKPASQIEDRAQKGEEMAPSSGGGKACKERAERQRARRGGGSARSAQRKPHGSGPRL